MRIIYLKFNTEFGTMNQALLFEEGETRTLFGFLICVNRLPLGLETVTTICVSVVVISGHGWYSVDTGLKLRQSPICPWTLSGFWVGVGSVPPGT